MLLLGRHHSSAKTTRWAQKPGGLAIDICIPVPRGIWSSSGAEGMGGGGLW